MVNLKKCVSLFLVLFLLFANSLVLAQETKTEIPFENSLYVLGSTSELVDFTESDFVGVDCQRVFMFSKEYDTSEKIYYYDAYCSYVNFNIGRLWNWSNSGDRWFDINGKGYWSVR